MRERIVPYHRTPKSVMRALAKASGERAPIGREAEPYEKDAILQWINAAAPMAASKLIEQVSGEDEDRAQKAAIAILQWCIGRPAAQPEGSLSASVQVGDRKIEISIVDPIDVNVGDPVNTDGNVIDAGAEEGGALTVQ